MNKMLSFKEPVVVAWAKQNGELPPGRCSDSGVGLLVITAVESEDSGTYVCTVTLGTFEVKKELELQVEGQGRMLFIIIQHFYFNELYVYSMKVTHLTNLFWCILSS